MRMLRYNYSICHVPGKNLSTADTLSRAPVPGEVEQNLQEEIEAYVNAIYESIPATERRLEEIHLHQEEDEKFRQLNDILSVRMPTQRYHLMYSQAIPLCSF